MASAGMSRTSMRVLYVHAATRPPLGADAWVHVQILGNLDPRTHDVYIACQRREAGATTPIYDAVRDLPGAHVVPVDLGPASLRARTWRSAASAFAAAPSFLRLLALTWRKRIDVVHVSDRPRDALVAVVLGRLSRARSIVHVHVGFNPTWMGRVQLWALRHADALVAVSDFVAETLTGDGGVAAERVHVVHNGIVVERWTPDVGGAAVREELAIGPDELVAVTVCRLFPAKGPVPLIRAIGTLRDRGVRVRLLVVGQPIDAEFGEELAQLVTDLGLGEQVHFLGRRDDVAAVMAAADVYAMPSHLEPFGLVFAEAMAMRRPVVGLADGGTLEVVDDGRDGLLSEFEDHEALVANLATLLGDAELRATMGAAGRERVLERFTVQRMATGMAEVYRAVTSAPDQQDDTRESGRRD